MNRIFSFLFLLSTLSPQLNAQCLSDSIYQFTFDNSTKTLTGKSYFTYDAQNGLTAENHWYSDGVEWHRSSRLIYTNNPDGSHASMIHQYWGYTNKWENMGQSIYSYSSPNKLSEIISKSWDTTAMTWNNRWKRQYIYNKNGKDSVYMTFNWKNSQWENETRYEYSYDGMGRKSERRGYTWTSGSWVPLQKLNHAYFNNSTEEISMSYQGGNWTNSGRKNTSYNLSTSYPNTILEQNWNNGSWVNSVETKYAYYISGCTSKADYFMNWSQNDSSWGYHLQDSFFGPFTGIHDIVKQNLHVYPNPADHELFIDAVEEGEYTLMDISGRIAMEGRIEQGINLIVTVDLEPGIYILHTKEGFSTVMLR